MTLSAEAMQRLASAARRRGATISYALVAALAEAVSSVTGATDMVIGVLVAKRGHPTLADVVTCLLDAVSLRLRACGQGLDATVTECRTEMTDALSNQDLPLPKVTRLLGAGDGRGRPPHDLLFALQIRPATVLSTGGLPVQVFQPTSREMVAEARLEPDGGATMALLHANRSDFQEMAERIAEALAGVVRAATAGSAVE
ncbi:condensation domain-containing protein [Streptomyces sp. NPDC002076]